MISCQPIKVLQNFPHSHHIFWVTFFVEYIARDSHSLNTLTALQFYTPKAYLVWINLDFYTFSLFIIPDFMKYQTTFSRSILLKFNQCEEGDGVK